MSVRKSIIFAWLLTVVCIVAGAAGCGYNNTPYAHFIANSTAGYAPLSVWFTDLSLGEIDSWTWDFEDDGVVDSTQQNVMHTYEQPGNYTVNLTVGEGHRRDSQIRLSFIVVSPPLCQADFVAAPTVCTGTTEVQFTDLSTGGVTGWSWDMNGDGIIDSTDQNPVYTYSRNGLYSVTLTVTTANCLDTITKDDYINVSGCSG